MQLEEAMEKVLTLINIYEHEHDENIPNEIICMNINERDSKALRTVLQALENSVPKEVIEEKKHKVELPNVIVGGRRNAKTLDYGKRLGKIEAFKELLEEK